MSKAAPPFHVHDPLRARDELSALEPVVHGERYFQSTREQIAEVLHDSYWEVASNGVVYRRDEVLDSLTSFHRERHDPMLVSALNVDQIADDVWLCAYTLDIGGRLSLRTTIWRWSGTHWQALFHQGTPTA